MSKKTEYINRYNKEHYDRINMSVPKGYKERIQAAASGLGISVNEYLFTLICNDLNGVSGTIKEQKSGFSDEDRRMLEKLQVGRKYFDMIEDVSYSKENGYYINLKEGYVNDVSGSRCIYARTSHEMRRVITNSHRMGEVIRRQPKKVELVADWLADEEVKQLERWQVPKKYYPAIESLSCGSVGYAIHLKKGYVNDASGSDVVEFKTVTELRGIMKLTHKSFIASIPADSSEVETAT